MKEWNENEQKKRYLMSYIWAKQQEERILEEIQMLRADKMFPSVVNGGMPKSNNQKDLSGYAAKLDGLIQSLKAERLKKIQKLSHIEKSIRELKNEDEQTILRMRYINGMKWEEVCVAINYEWAQMHRIHSRALKEIKIYDDTK